MRAQGRREPVSWRRRADAVDLVRRSRAPRSASGWRWATLPSRSISTTPKPRGRSRWRSGPFASGSVSVSTTTSRSARSSSRASSMRICCTKRGSSGLSAKTTSGRRPSSRRARRRLGSVCAAGGRLRDRRRGGQAARPGQARSCCSPCRQELAAGAGCERKSPAGGAMSGRSEGLAGAGAKELRGEPREPDLGDAGGDRGQAALYRGRPRGARRISAACRGSRPTPAGRGRRCTPGGRGRSASTPASRRPRSRNAFYRKALAAGQQGV